MGNIRDHLPECITTDLFPNPWLDRVENAYHLSFPDASWAISFYSMSGIISNTRPTLLAEFRRVLVPRGRVILLEPAMSRGGADWSMGIATMSPWASIRPLISWPIWMRPIPHATSPPSHRLTVFLCDASYQGCLRAGKFVPSVQSLPSRIWDRVFRGLRSIPKPFNSS